jgi:hypothetical protein
MYFHIEPRAEELLDSPEYYTFREDASALAASSDIPGHVSKRGFDRIIELGPGDVSAFRHKVAPLVRWVSPREYIGVDFSPHILSTVAAYCESQFPDLITRRIECDFFNSPRKIPTARNSLIAIYGNTFGDYPYYRRGFFPVARFAKYLRAVKPLRHTNSALLLSVDVNCSQNSILKSYSGDSTRRFFNRSLNWLIDQDARYEEVISHLRPRIDFDFGANCVVFALRSTSDRALAVPGTDSSIPPHADLIIGVSYRFSDARLSEICSLAGMGISEQQSAPGGTTRLLLID